MKAWSRGAQHAGEASFHSGWTFHRADGNSTEQPRKVMTAIYMDKDIRMIEPQHANHRADHARYASCFCMFLEHQASNHRVIMSNGQILLFHASNDTTSYSTWSVYKLLIIEIGLSCMLAQTPLHSAQFWQLEAIWRDEILELSRLHRVCRWLPGVQPGEIAASHRNPIVYSAS